MSVQRLALLALLLSLPVSAEGLGWRLDGDGRFPEARPPIEWSPDDNVVWKTAMPDVSNASPVLLADKSLVFVLSEPDTILAVNADDGAIVWQDSTGDVTDKKVGAHKANGRATPTPVTDGKHVFAVFGSGVVAAYTVDGQRVWARVVQRPKHRWGHSASPTLAAGRLVVHLVDVFGLDPATGKEVWRAESQAKWGSPVIATVGDTDVVVTPVGDVFRADDGTTIAAGIGRLDYATPVVQDGVIYFIAKRATAVRVPDALDQPFETLWEARIQGSRHYASPVVDDGLVYAVSREERFTILDATDGSIVLERALDLGSGANSAYPSLAVAGDHLFVSAENGTTVVLETGREYNELARNAVEGFRSSPLFVGDRLYLRAFDNLYCFRQQP